MLFERLDWRPYGIRPVLPIAATVPPGEPVRIDIVTAERASRLRERLTLADDDRDLGEALDRWELSLFQADPFASEQLRGSLAAALGAGEGLFAASLRAAALLGETPRERVDVLDRLRLLARGDAAAATGDLVRRTLVQVLEDGDRAKLVDALDESLLGLGRSRPEGWSRCRQSARSRTFPSQTRDALPGSVASMEEARQVLERLARIEELEREQAPASELLDELRELVREAETWLRTEPEPAGRSLARCRTALATRGARRRCFSRAEQQKTDLRALCDPVFRHTECVQDSPVPGRRGGE